MSFWELGAVAPEESQFLGCANAKSEKASKELPLQTRTAERSWDRLQEQNALRFT
jgi:hypothetical protein